jgi:tetracycline resistance efflux pump
MVIILMIGYIMQNVMYSMGMEAFVHTVLGGIPIVKLIPFILFAFFSCTEYLYSLNYTLYQIAIPVLMVVLTKIGANVPLCLGALISAGLFGANACVVSDLGVISARACRVKIYEQYETSLPYFIISAVITGVLYLIAGFVF